MTIEGDLMAGMCKCGAVAVVPVPRDPTREECKSCGRVFRCLAKASRIPAIRDGTREPMALDPPDPDPGDAGQLDLFGELLR